MICVCDKVHKLCPELCRQLSPVHCNGLNSIRATQTGLSRTCHGLCRKHLDVSRWFVSATFPGGKFRRKSPSYVIRALLISTLQRIRNSLYCCAIQTDCVLYYYGAVLPRRRPHHVSILSVCLSVCLSRAYFFLRIGLST